MTAATVDDIEQAVIEAFRIVFRKMEEGRL